MPHTGVVRLYLSMFNEKNVQPVCDTLRRFQSKIKVLEIYLNNANPMQTVQELQNQALGRHDRMASPIRPTNSHSTKCFPRVQFLFQLIKSLKVASTVRIVCDTESAIFVQEGMYHAFITSLSRQ